MKLKKKSLFLFGLVLPLALNPSVFYLTSCAKNWANPTPLIIGSAFAGDKTDPYYHFRQQKLYTHDGKDMIHENYFSSLYVQTDKRISSYTLPNSKNESDEVTWNTFDKSSPIFKEINELEIKDKKTAILANTNIVSEIANQVKTLIDGGFSYQNTTVNDWKKTSNAWGGKLEFTASNKQNEIDLAKKNYYELAMANSNCHSTGKTNTFFKTTQMNFNFAKDFFPFPTYDFVDKKNNGFSSSFKQILEGNNIAYKLLSNKGYDCHWNQKVIPKKNVEGKQEKKTIFIYDCVPILIEPQSLIKSYVNPMKNNDDFSFPYYQNDIKQINNAIGDTWKTIMKGKVNENIYAKNKQYLPTYKSFELKIDEKQKPLKISHPFKDTRLPKEINGNNFIALFKYKIVEYENEPEKNIVSLSLQTIFPTYFLEICHDNDLFIKASEKHNESGYIININKILEMKEKLLNIYSHKITNYDKKYLQFLNYLFSDNNKIFLDKIIIGHFKINNEN